MEPWNPCLQEAFQLAAFLYDVGIHLRVEQKREGSLALKFRDPHKFLTPELRLMAQARRDDIVALLTRYDQWHRGSPPPVLNADNWPDASQRLQRWLNATDEEMFLPELNAESIAMRLVWDWRNGVMPTWMRPTKKRKDAASEATAK